MVSSLIQKHELEEDGSQGFICLAICFHEAFSLLVPPRLHDW